MMILQLVKKSGDVSSSAAAPTSTATSTTIASPHASTSSTTSSDSTTTPVPNATNADSPITSKESKPKKKKVGQLFSARFLGRS